MDTLQSSSANLNSPLMEQNGKVSFSRKVGDLQWRGQRPLCAEALLLIPPHRQGIGAPLPSERLVPVLPTPPLSPHLPMLYLVCK